MGGERYKGVLVGKLVRKRPLGKPRNRWENNIKTVIQEVGCEGMDWMRRRLGTSGGGLL